MCIGFLWTHYYRVSKSPVIICFISVSDTNHHWPLMLVLVAYSLAGHTGHLLKSLCFCSMTFLFIHIVYQITIHSLLAANSIVSEFNCKLCFLSKINIQSIQKGSSRFSISSCTIGYVDDWKVLHAKLWNY